MPTVTLDFPADEFPSLFSSPDEFAREFRLAAAIHWYERGEISQVKSAISPAWIGRTFCQISFVSRVTRSLLTFLI